MNGQGGSWAATESGTGLRIGEALGLDDHDVDLDAAVLFVRRGKNDKSRLISVTDTYWYIEAVPELLSLASERAEQYFVDKGVS